MISREITDDNHVARKKEEYIHENVLQQTKREHFIPDTKYEKWIV